MFRAGSKILYIGKATSLRDRARSYFSKDLIETRGPLILDMVFKAKSLKWTVTDSVLEALVLEANLIKKYQPIYNTKEKSDKSFNHVVITKDKKVVVVRGKDLVVKNYDSVYGPYTSGASLREALKIIRKIFPYFDAKSGIKGRQEFYRQIGLTPNDSKEYRRNIKNIKLFFEGKKSRILKNLEKEMKEYAKRQEFEKANEIKRQLFALKHINDVALIKDESFADRKIFHPFRIEAYDVAHMAGSKMVGVMTVVEDGLPAQAGEINKNEYRKFKIRGYDKANDPGALKEILERRFAHPEWKFPNLIVVDGGKAQINSAKKVLIDSGLAEIIDIVSVVKDERHRPKSILGEKNAVIKREKEILLANSEAHRFAIKYHRNLLRKRL